MPPKEQELLQSISDLLSATLLSDPHRLFSLVHAAHPGMCRDSRISVYKQLSAAETASVVSTVPAKEMQFISHILVQVDTPYVVSFVIYRDGRQFFADLATPPEYEYYFTQTGYYPTQATWELAMTNNSAFTVNVHIIFSGWFIDRDAWLNRIKPEVDKYAGRLITTGRVG